VILLAPEGLDVVVLDRDQPPPGHPDEAWKTWQRSVGQFRLVHCPQPGGRVFVEQEQEQALA
jgi:hypothetical protein